MRGGRIQRPLPKTPRHICLVWATNSSTSSSCWTKFPQKKTRNMNEVPEIFSELHPETCPQKTPDASEKLGLAPKVLQFLCEGSSAGFVLCRALLQNPKASTNVFWGPFFSSCHSWQVETLSPKLSPIFPADTMRHKSITYPEKCLPEFFFDYRYLIWAFSNEFWKVLHLRDIAQPIGPPVLVELFLIPLPIWSCKFSELFG